MGVWSLQEYLRLGWSGCVGSASWCGCWRERLEIGPLDGYADGDVAILEFHAAIGAGIIRKPVFPIDIFAIGLKGGKGKRRRTKLAKIGNPLAVSFYDFQIFLVHPDNAVEQRIPPVQRFR